MKIKPGSIPLGFIPVSTAARLLNCHQTTLLSRISRGEIPAQRLPGPFVVAESSIELLLAQQASKAAHAALPEIATEART